MADQSAVKRKYSAGEEKDTKKQRTEDSGWEIDDAELAQLLAEATEATLASVAEGLFNGPDTNGHALDPEMDMRLKSLPFLENHSSQLLDTFARGPWEQTANILVDPSSEIAQLYSTQKFLFDDSLKIYSREPGFLSTDELGLTDEKHISIIRTANLVIFLCSIFSPPGIDFHDLNEHFIEVFVPMGGELDEELGELVLSLKTQLYLGIVQEDEETDKEAILSNIFPDDLGASLLRRHPEKELTLAESKFLTKLFQRHKFLQDNLVDADSIAAYSEENAWDTFIQALSKYINKNYASTSPSPMPNLKGGSLLTDQDIIDEAEKAAALTFNQIFSHDGLPRDDYGQQNSHLGSPRQYMRNGNHPQQAQNGQMNTFHTAPTSILYEQARQASTNKSSPHNRRPGLPSQRRPWTQEEENALMAGLDAVHGPHWSQILALYGQNGSRSEILKDRNQVQLKDKARNLKLFFLKSGITVPYYLQNVTGELRTRAPHAASKKEAGERARGGEFEAQAHAMAAPNGVGHPSNWPSQPPQHHSPYALPQSPSPYRQQAAAQQPMEKTSSSSGAEILDPVGPRGEIKSEAQQPAALPQHSEQAQSQERAMQQAMQEMSAEEQLASRLRAEVNGTAMPAKPAAKIENA